MAKTVYNKNVANPSDITASVFSSDEQLKYGEIVLCNNINEPGIYIFAKNDGGETKIQKINSADNIILKQNVDPSLSGPVANGDTLYEMVSKLQNQLDDLSGSGESEAEKINRIIVAIDLNDDGSYKIISGNYVGDATSIADAISKLDAAINTVGGSSVEEAKEYTDAKITESIEALDTEVSAGDGEVFVKITEADGLVSGEAKALSVEKDATGLKYDLKLGDYVFGSVDIPQDQFLKEVIFISAATVEDVAEALNYGQRIELGKPYLKFVWKLEEGLKPTYVDVSGLIDVYTAADVKLSDAYSGASFDIKSGTSVEDAIGKVTNELTSIEESIESNKVNSSEKTINVTTSDTGTNIDINIDNDTIVKNETVAKQGQLSVALNVEKTHVDTGYVRTKYTLKSKDGSYGVINDTRDVFVGDETDGFIKVETQAVSDTEGNRTDKITITPVIQKTVNNATGPNVDDANGLVTAWGVKEYVRSGIDGDGIMVGDDVLQPYENYRGHINFDSSSIDYDTVHKALYKTDNNMQLLDEALGFESSGQNVHQYPSATTQDCLLIKGDRTVMDALKTLDKSIADLDFEDNCGENQVFTAFTQENGHVMLEKQNVTGRKLAEYSVVDVTNPSGATFKVATTDTLGQALGKLQGQINAMDWTGTTTSDQVFTGITEKDGLVSASTADVTTRTLKGYSVQSITDTSAAASKIATGDTLGVGLGKLQGQINAMDYTANTSSDKVFTYISNKDGQLTTSAENITNRVITGYVEGTDADVAATDTLGVALGKLQGQINAMDKAAQAEENSVIYDVTESDGKVSATSKHIVDIKLSGYTEGAIASGKVSSGDTLGHALGKLQGQINAMDLSSGANDNKVMTDLTQKDGQLTPTYSNVTSRKLDGYGTTANTKVAATQTLGVALGNLQGQIDSLDYTANASTDKVITAITQTDGKVEVETQNITSRIITGYAEGIDADVAETDTLGQALGKLQKQINSMDKTASSETGKFVRTVAEADGKVSETRGYIVADDVKITAATVNEANVKEAWKLVNNEGTQLGSTIKIYKDSSLKSVALSGDTSTVGQWLVFTYALSDGSEDVVAVDVSKFLVQAEFQSGVTADNSGIVHGVVYGNSESVVTAYTATGSANGTAKVLGVNGGGFYVNNIQTAINAKVNSAISLLDSSSATTNAGYYMTGITITDGKVTAIGQAKLTSQETELSTGNSTTAIGNVVTGLSVSDHAITLNKKDFPEVAWKRVTAGGTNIDATTTADTISIVTGNTGITLAGDAANKRITIGHTDTSSQASVDAGSGKFIKSVSVDTYGHVTGLTTGNTVDSATTAVDSAKVAGKTVGNANGNVPLSNGTVNTNLNADMIDGKHIAVVSAIPSSPDANTIYILA